MRIYLSKKQMAFIAAPFVLSCAVYFVSEDIVSNANYIFPSYEEFSDNELGKKVDIYFSIEEKRAIYEEIGEKIQKREKDRSWVAQELFFEEEKPKIVPPIVEAEKKREEIAPKEYQYKVEALYPKDKVAIINGVVLKEGGTIGDAEVVEIKENSVLLKNKKGLKWINMF